MKSHLKLPSKKSSTIDGTLVKPFVENSKIASWRNYSKANMRRVSVSSDTIQRHISNTLEDVKDQVINESISNLLFSSG